MRILITRPLEDAGPLAAALSARGHTVAIEPMLEIASLPDLRPLDLGGVQAVLFTSANGVRAFARLSQGRELPVFAVGDASARAARQAGFARVESAAGDVADLARLIAAKLRPKDGALYHGAARQVAGDLKGALEAAGFEVRRAVLYEARAARALSAAARTALTQGNLDAAVFFSPRSAQTFVSLVQGAGLTATCARLDAICLSAGVSEQVRVLNWRGVRVAARLDQDALLECIDAMAGPGSAAVEEKMPADDKATERSQDAPVPAGAGAETGAASEAETGAHAVIAAFGGIRPMASKLGVAVSTVQGWRERGSIPAARHQQITTAAKTHGIAVDAKALATSDRGPESHGEAKGEAKTETKADTKAARGAGGTSAKPTPSGIPPSGTASLRRESSETAPTTAAPTKAASSGGTWTGAFLIAALVFVVGAGAAVLTREAWAPYFAAPQDAPREDPNAARLDSLEGRLAELAARPSGASSEAVAEMAAELEALRGEVAGLRGALDGELAGLGARIESLGEVARAAGDAGNTEELVAILAQLKQDSARIEGALGTEIAALRAALAAQAEARKPAPPGESAQALAILQMRDALRGAEPFAPALAALEGVAAKVEGAPGEALRAAIAPLKPHAARGAPSLESLRADFPAVARAVIAQSHGGEGDGLLANAIRRLSGLVSVRPLGPVEGTAAEAVVARAEAQLEAGNLASALAELDALSGPAAEAAEPWRARAEARRAAQTALQRLGGLLLAAHAAGKS